MKTETEKELRGLDAWIAEHVMGHVWYYRTNGVSDSGLAWNWKIFLSLPPEGGVGKYWIGQAGETRLAEQPSIMAAKARIEFVEGFPYYTTNPADALAVLEKCAEKMPLVIYKGATDGNWYVEHEDDYACSVPFSANSKALPVAICKIAQQIFAK